MSLNCPAETCAATTVAGTVVDIQLAGLYESLDMRSPVSLTVHADCSCQPDLSGIVCAARATVDTCRIPPKMVAAIRRFFTLSLVDRVAVVSFRSLTSARAATPAVPARRGPGRKCRCLLECP